MQRFSLFLVMVCAMAQYLWADISVQTRVINSDSQPPIVGGVINDYVYNTIVKTGVLVSINNNDLIVNSQSPFLFPYYEGNMKNEITPANYRQIECSNIGKEQFWCPLVALKSEREYYVKAYAIKADGNIIYGQTESVHSQRYNRYDGTTDYANVWHAFDCTLFDLITDEIINPNDGFYYSTNENPRTVRRGVGTSYNTCYKFATEWNYKLWYYHSTHCDEQKIVNSPIMSYKDGRLTIVKNSLDANKNITLYYSINGNFFRPETYTNVYSTPIEITEPCYVCCYAKSSDGYISYTNLFVVDNDGQGDNYSEVVAEAIDLGLPSGTLWATCNIGASSPEEYGDYFSWGELTPKESFSLANYRFYEDGNYTKYNSTDGKTTLDPEDDAAHILWGDGWSIPSVAEREELISNCTWVFTTHGTVKGYQITGSNGNSIFLPAGGYYHPNYIEKNEHGVYWINEVDNLMYAKNLSFGLGYRNKYDDRDHGLNIRPIYNATFITDRISNLNVESSNNKQIYSINGQRRHTMGRGINIVRMSNGAVKKIAK